MLKQNILEAASAIVRRYGLENLTRVDVAGLVGCGAGTINYHFKTMSKLRSAIISHAITGEDGLVLAHFAGDPRIMGRLTPALKERVAAHIAGK